MSGDWRAEADEEADTRGLVPQKLSQTEDLVASPRVNVSTMSS